MAITTYQVTVQLDRDPRPDDTMPWRATVWIGGLPHHGRGASPEQALGNLAEAWSKRRAAEETGR